VALVLPTGAELAACTIATSAAATCAPLNPSFRQSEFESYLTDLRPELLIVAAGNDSPARAAARARGVRVADLHHRPEQPAGLCTLGVEPSVASLDLAAAGDIALILHTSGTTARPKVVPLTHRNLTRATSKVAAWLTLTADDRYLNVMPLFHGHGLVGGVLTALAGGGAAICAPDASASSFFDWLQAFGPTWYSASPAMHQAFLARARATGWRNPGTRLRFVRSASAALPTRAAAELEEVFGVPVIEAYGATEAPGNSIASNPLPPGLRKPGSVGVPLACEVRIQDDAGAEVPAGSPGHIVVRGETLSAGYLNAAEETSAFVNGWFRTGDVGHVDPDGYLYLTGRSDDVINRGGEKIAPREVDDVLLTHPAVADAVTFAIPDSRLGEDVGAAVVLKARAHATAVELQAFAARSLADYKVPRLILLLDALPTSATGKPQRSGLAARLGVTDASATPPAPPDYAAPRTADEGALAAIWKDVLRIDRVGIHDDFFDLGGDSVLAAQVLARVSDQLGVTAAMYEIFNARTLERFATAVRHRASDRGTPGRSPIGRRPAGKSAPLSFAQERMWFLSQFGDAGAAYVLPVVVRVTGELDLDALRRGLRRVMERHAILRTRYAFEDGLPTQHVAAAAEIPLEASDVLLAHGDTVEDLANRLAREEAATPIALTAGVPIRARVVRLGLQDQLLVITIHHIASDGWSKSLLFRDLELAYAAARSGGDVIFSDRPAAYSDYAAWQRDLVDGPDGKRMLAFWTDRLSGAPHALNLPADHPRPLRQAFTGSVVRRSLPPALADNLKTIAHAHASSLYMLLLAAFSWLLGQYSRQSDILVGTPTAGRTTKETEGIVGLFVNTLVMRANLAGDPTFTELLGRVRDHALQAYEHQNLPFERLIDALDVERDLGRSPLCQVLFQLRNHPEIEPRLEGAACAAMPVDPGTAQFELNLDITETANGLACALTYCDALFERTTAEDMLADFAAILETVAARPGSRRADLPALRVAPVDATSENASAEFWRERLAGLAAPTPLVIDRSSRLEGARLARQRVSSPIAASAVDAFTSRVAQHDLSAHDALFGAWVMLLSRYSGEKRLVVGIAGWNAAPHGAMLPIRIDVARELGAGAVVRSAAGQRDQARPHALMPLEAIRRLSEMPEGASLFDSLVAMDSGGDDDRASVPVVISIEAGDGLHVVIDVDPRRLDRASAARAASHLCRIMEAVAIEPAVPSMAVDILNADERRRLVVEWNRTDTPFSDDATLQSLFDAQVARTPDAVALVYGNATLTYAELQTRAHQLGRFLQGRGVGPNVLVGLCVERSVEMVVGLLGILHAGGAYVPIDPAYPAERLAFMLADAGVGTLLTQSHLLSRLPSPAAETVCLDSQWPAIEAGASAATERHASSAAGDLAYMIYTSGSTGRPKGALNAHRGIVNRLEWMQRTFALTATDVVLQKTPFSFDVSVWEFFWPLMSGARLVLAKPGGHQDPAYLVDVIQRERVSVLHFVPSMLRVFLDTPRVADCRTIRALICSGEALPPDLVDACHATLRADVHNLYGPTEAAVDVTWWACPRTAPTSIVPIGRPIANTQCYVLDTRLQPVPIGVPGELHLGGIQVGRGYHGRPELTADRFIPDPFHPARDARLYKTGDLCRFLDTGEIEYLGRLDHQVKIRGLRIELGEVETAVVSVPDVKEAVIVVAEAGLREQQLVAYVVPRQADSFSEAAAREHVSRVLPEYMVPSAFVVLSALPLSPNGKLDRKALPAVERRAVAGRPVTLPSSDLEKAIAEAWCSVLGVSRVGTTETFFEAGGDSLKLMRVQHRLSVRMGVEVPSVELFQYPTVGALAAHLAGGSAASSHAEASSSIRERAQRQRQAAQRKKPAAVQGARA
jgi:amino acid adenylation domain-containing protein